MARWASKKAQYQTLGYGSVRPHPQGQQEMFPETDTRPPFRQLNRLSGLSPEQRQLGEQKLGATLGEATQRMGHFLDAAFDQSASRHPEGDTGPIHAAGQHWYAGGEGTERSEIGAMAREHGVPFHTAAAIKATVAQNIGPEQENHVTDQILHQAGQGIDPRKMKASMYDNVVERGGRHTLNPAADPLTTRARDPISVHEMNNPEKIPHAMAGYKPPGYYQSYSYPHDERTRPAIDRWMFRAGNPSLSTDDISKIQGGLGKPLASEGPTDLAGAHAAHAHRILDEAVRRAGAARGLTPTETQTTIWHHVRNSESGHMVNPNQMKMF